MKIVDTDNFGGDYPDEKFLSFSREHNGIQLTEDAAKKICEILNRGGKYSLRYYKIVPNDYKLQPRFTP